MTEPLRQLTQLRHDYDSLKREFTICTLKTSRQLHELKSRLEQQERMASSLLPLRLPLAPQTPTEG